MEDSEVNISQIRLFFFEFKRVMLICFLFLLSFGGGIIVSSFYPQISPLSLYELQEILPPFFFILHITSQIALFLLIFFAGYFIAEYRIELRTRRCQIIENRSKST